MKLKNIFKKETKKVVKSEVQSLDKKQLEKVIGGTTSEDLNKRAVLSGHSGGWS